MMITRRSTNGNGGVAVRRDPWDEMFNSFLAPTDFVLRPVMNSQNALAFVPPVDVIRNEDSLIVRAEVPGVAREDIELTIDGNRLTIRGTKRTEEKKEDERYHMTERTHGEFERTFSLPSDIDGANAHADFKNGVLEIRLPVAEAARPRKIEVRAN